MLRTDEIVGIMMLEPHELGPDELLAIPRAGEADELFLGHEAAEPFEFLQCPRIVLLDAAPQRPALFIEEDDGGEHAGNPDAGQGLAARSAFAHELPDDLTAVLPPFRWLLRSEEHT